MNTDNKPLEGFLTGAAALLFVLAACNFALAALGGAALDAPDELLRLPARVVLLIFATAQLSLSAYLLLGDRRATKLVLLAWLASNLAVYRIGMQSNHLPDFTDCLGNFTRLFPIPPRTLFWFLQTSIAVMLVGAYGFLVAGWLAGRKNRRASAAKP